MYKNKVYINITSILFITFILFKIKIDTNKKLIKINEI